MIGHLPSDVSECAEWLAVERLAWGQGELQARVGGGGSANARASIRGARVEARATNHKMAARRGRRGGSAGWGG